jgi:hypothetical protein
MFCTLGSIQRGLIALTDVSTSFYGIAFVISVLAAPYSVLEDDDQTPTPSPTEMLLDDDKKKYGPSMVIGFFFGFVWLVAEGVSFVSTCWQRSFNVFRIQFSTRTLVLLKITGLFHYFGVYFGSISYAASILLYDDGLHHIRTTQTADIRNLLNMSNGAIAIVVVTSVTFCHLSLYLFPDKGKKVSWPIQLAWNIYECGYQAETDVVYVQGGSHSYAVTRFGARECSTATLARGKNFAWLNSRGGQGCWSGPPCCWPDNIFAKLLFFPLVLALNICSVPFYYLSFCFGHIFERATCLVTTFTLGIPCLLASAIAPTVTKAIVETGNGFYTLIDYNIYVGFVTSGVLFFGSVSWCMINSSILAIKIFPETVQSICQPLIQGKNATTLSRLWIVCKSVQFLVSIAHPILRLIFNHKIGVLSSLLSDYTVYVMRLAQLGRGEVVVSWLERIVERAGNSNDRDDALRKLGELRADMTRHREEITSKLASMEVEMDEIFEFIFDFDPNYKPSAGLPEHQDDYNPLAGEPACTSQDEVKGVGNKSPDLTGITPDEIDRT